MSEVVGLLAGMGASIVLAAVVLVAAARQQRSQRQELVEAYEAVRRERFERENTSAALDRVVAERSELQREARPRIDPGESIIACPACGSRKPHAPLVSLASGTIREGRAVIVTSGQIFACQGPGCSEIFCFGPEGTFRRDPRALPYLPSSEREAKSEAAPEKPGEPPRTPHPLPRERPRV